MINHLRAYEYPEKNKPALALPVPKSSTTNPTFYKIPYYRCYMRLVNSGLVCLANRRPQRRAILRRRGRSVRIRKRPCTQGKSRETSTSVLQGLLICSFLKNLKKPKQTASCAARATQNHALD